jgi:glycosyltransferase involved in cell wall biosynthesis
MNDVHLERPDIFAPKLFYQSGNKISQLLSHAGDAASGNTYRPNIAVLIRTKNDSLGLQRWLEHIARARERYVGRIDVVVVDTESSDTTLQLARDFGAKVVPVVQEGFSYPKTMNLGLEAVAHDVEVAFITVGHAQPVLSNCLDAGVRHFKDTKVVGVYGNAIIHENASFWERRFFMRPQSTMANASVVTEPRLGVMGATNCLIRMSTWRKYRLDERYSAGGEDTAWAWDALQRGEVIIYDPAVSVHHSHHLTFLNLYRQRVHWGQILKAPQAFSEEEMRRRRPDLFKS